MDLCTFGQNKSSHDTRGSIPSSWRSKRTSSTWSTRANSTRRVHAHALVISSVPLLCIRFLFVFHQSSEEETRARERQANAWKYTNEDSDVDVTEVHQHYDAIITRGTVVSPFGADDLDEEVTFLPTEPSRQPVVVYLTGVCTHELFIIQFMSLFSMPVVALFLR